MSCAERAASKKGINMNELPNLEYLFSVQCVALIPLEIKEIELLQPVNIEKLWIDRKSNQLMVRARMESIEQLQSKPIKKKYLAIEILLPSCSYYS